MAPDNPPAGETWPEYRLLVLAELERMEKRSLLVEDRLNGHIETATQVQAGFEKELEIQRARHIGFTKEAEQLYQTEADVKGIVRSIIEEALDRKVAEVLAETPREPRAGLRARWEFWGLVVSSLSAVILALISLVG